MERVAQQQSSGRLPQSKQEARERIAIMGTEDVNPETGQPIPPRHDGVPAYVLGTSVAGAY